MTWLYQLLVLGSESSPQGSIPSGGSGGELVSCLSQRPEAPASLALGPLPPRSQPQHSLSDSTGRVPGDERRLPGAQVCTEPERAWETVAGLRLEEGVGDSAEPSCATSRCDRSPGCYPVRTQRSVSSPPNKFTANPRDRIRLGTSKRSQPEIELGWGQVSAGSQRGSSEEDLNTGGLGSPGRLPGGGDSFVRIWPCLPFMPSLGSPLHFRSPGLGTLGWSGFLSIPHIRSFGDRLQLPRVCACPQWAPASWKRLGALWGGPLGAG